MKSFKRLSLFVLFGVFLFQAASQTVRADTIESTGSLTLSDRSSPFGLPATTPSSNPAPAADRETRPMADKARYDRLVDRIARLYGLESALLHAVISVESSYVPTAVSSRGALGLMQLMPGTAKRYGVANALDPVQNLHGGAKYLRDLLVMFHSDLGLTLAAYNAGEFSVARNGNRVPPGGGTAEFVLRVQRFYHRYQANR